MNGNRKMIETENASVDNQTKCIRCGCVFTDVDSEDEMAVSYTHLTLPTI